MTPITTVEQAIERIASYEGRAEDFQLPIAESLLDPVGMNMALIGDHLLAKGFLPDGFEQREGYRLYRYRSAK